MAFEKMNIKKLCDFLAQSMLTFRKMRSIAINNEKDTIFLLRVRTRPNLRKRLYELVFFSFVEMI